MSRYFTYYDLYNSLSARFRLGDIWNCISDLYDNKVSLSDCLDNTLSCQIADPYIISSIRQGYVKNGSETSVGILSIDGYRLSSGMKTVFDNAICSTGHLSTVIPSLDHNVKSVSPNNYITSITDYDGHVQVLGQKSLVDEIGEYASATDIWNKPAGDPAYDQVSRLQIRVLPYSEFNALRANGQISKNVIYMTVEDPDEVW